MGKISPLRNEANFFPAKFLQCVTNTFMPAAMGER